MAIDFPDSPSVNDVFTVGSRTWQWNGTTWSMAPSTGVSTVTGTSLSVLNEFTLPTTDGTASQVMVTDGSGGVTWSDVAAAPAGSSGEVQFNNAGSTAGASGLFYDVANDRLGIGTTSPDKPLHVYHATMDSPLRVESGDSRGAIEFKDSTQTTTVAAGALGNDFTVYAGGADRFAVTSSGNVGIGTTSPSQALDVTGTVTATSLAVTGQFTLPTTDGSADQIMVTDGSGGVTWQDNTASGGGAAGSDGQVQYNNGGVAGGASSLYYDDVNNRVGIGTTSPSSELDVAGTVTASGLDVTVGSESVTFTSTYSDADRHVMAVVGLEPSTGSTVASLGTHAGDEVSSGNLSFSHTLSSGSNRIVLIAVMGETGGTPDDSVSYGGVSATLLSTTEDPTNVQFIRWHYVLEANLPADGSKTVSVTRTNSGGASVWVGTFSGVNQSAPSAPTTASSSSSAAITTGSVTSSLGEMYVAAGSVNDNVGSVYGLSLSWTGDSAMVSTHQAYSHSFSNAVSYASGGGYILSATGSAVTVSGAFTLPTTDGSADQFLKTDGSGTTSWGSVTATASPAGSDGQLQYNNGGATGGTSSLYYDDVNSRLGIGTTSPGHTLSFGTPADGSRQIGLYEDANAHYGLGTDFNRLAFYASNSAGTAERMVINSDGDVGIGTTSPEAPLDIVTTGTGSWQRGIRLLNSGMASGDELMVAVGLADAARNLGQMYFHYDSSGSTSNRLSFGLHSQDDVLNITGGGNVGIGTASPGAELDVSAASSPDIRLTSEKNGSWTDGESMGSLSFYSSDTSGGGAGVRGRVATVAGDTFGYTSELALSVGGDSGLFEAVRIDHDGNVGIGTTSPTGEFELTANTSEMIFSSSPNKTNRYRIDANFTDAADFGLSLGYWDGAAYQRTLTIDDSGNVGIGNTAPAAKLSVTGNIYNSGVIESDGTYTNTTGSSANMHVSSGGFFYRSTVSSIKYKTDVETMEDSYADAILGLRPVWYRSLCEHDPDSWGYWGFIAEEVDQIDPRLVTYTVPEDYEWQYGEDGQKLEPAAEDLTVPDAVQYDRLVPHLVNLVKRQRDELDELRSRVEALEA